MDTLKELFLLDPEVVFLNHGSFGACPIPVFEVYQNWQRRLESQPVSFIATELIARLAETRILLGEYINALAEDVVLIPNATFGVNIIAHSLALRVGDVVLATDHEYGACSNAWEFVCRKKGA
jgi:isopenicillin-N epimerase